MIGGFNHNIRYKGRVFHVQSEDLGFNLARIRSHVFFNGAVVAESSQSYADLMRFAMTQGQRIAQIRARIQDLHKNSLKLLTQGAYDQLIQQRLQTSFPPGPPPASPKTGAVNDPELQAMLAQVQTTRPSADQSPPNLGQTGKNDSTPPVNKPKAEKPKIPEPPKTSIPGRAPRLFPKSEKKEKSISDAERIKNAKVSRSQSSMVKNRKEKKSDEEKDKEAKAMVREAKRSRGAHHSTQEKPKNKTEKSAASDAQTSNKPHETNGSGKDHRRPSSGPIPSQAPATQAPQALDPNRGRPMRPQSAPAPQVARPIPSPARRPITQVPVTNVRGPVSYPRAPSAYPLQAPLPARSQPPMTHQSSRPPIAMPNPRPTTQRRPRSFPPGYGYKPG